MEPGGPPLTPGSSYGPPPTYSITPTFLSHIVQSSCSPNASEELMPGKSPWGGAGDEEQTGGPGRSELTGGPGMSELTGGPGRSELTGGPGRSELTGGPGRSELTEGPGRSELTGGPGRNELTGGPGRSELTEGPGRSELTGGPGRSELTGGPGRSELTGGPGRSELTEGPGPSELTGGPGRSELTEGPGTSELTGGPGTSELTGGPGRSELTEGPGRSELTGGPGRSELTEGPGRSELTGGPGRSELTGGPGRSELTEGPGRSELTGDPGRSELTGGPGRSELTGGPGRSELTGGPGRSEVTEGPGRSELTGGPGRSELTGGPGRSELTGGPGRSELTGGPGRSELTEGPGRSELTGGPGRSELTGGPGRSEQTGGPGRSELTGGPGRSELTGGPGRSELTGGPGRSELTEGPGRSELTELTESPGRSELTGGPGRSELTELTEGPGRSELTGGPGRSAQRRFRPSAFPSSLTWDSDSEKETLDEEELQHFSNPHGLAAHSPGSPSSGLRLDDADDQAPETLQHSLSKSDDWRPADGQDGNNGSTKTEDPNTSELGPTELAESGVWNVSESAELLLSNVKPKDGRQAEEEEDNIKGKKRQKGKDTKEPERDVYTFPGDSDPESPPPAPWAHCTFVQRCRKKRVLLRPFSGLGTWQRTVPEAGGRRARGGPQRPIPAESAQLSRDRRVYDFEEMNFEEPAKFNEENVGGGEKGEAESEAEPGNDIFTCVECSIYFKKQIHLQEHMTEHCQSGSGGGKRDRLAKGSRFRCVECGWNLLNRLALTNHHRRHQESREKILEEIEKLNGEGKVEEIRTVDTKLMDHISPDPAVVQEPGPGSTPDPEMVTTSPTLSPVPVSALDSDPVAVLDSDGALTPPPKSVRTPARARAVPAGRRRYVCSKCNFSTRTPQALANHAKTHNRKTNAPRRASPCLHPKFPVVEADSLPPGSPSTSLACGHCAFLAPSQTVLREHQNLLHPGQASLSGPWAEEMSQHSSSSVGDPVSKSVPDSDHLSGSGSTVLTSASEASAPGHPAPNSATAPSAKCTGNRRANRRGKNWTELSQFPPRLDVNTPPEKEDKQDESQSTEVNTELNQKETDLPVGLKPQTRARSNRDDSSSTQQRVTSSSCPKKSLKGEEEHEEVEKDEKVSILRRSNRVIAALAENDSDNDDIDEEDMRRLLSEGILDEDEDEIDEETGALRSVERKCPYCPDRFHNGIGLANHVRGHLNRVGVSYNVRHFISPEEVNAIEKKFSYQKKKKKVANFDPDTFSVMRCEFCSAGFDTRAGLSSHARAHLRDFGITNWDVTVSPIHILRELFSSRPDLVIPTAPPRSPDSEHTEDEEEEDEIDEDGEEIIEVKLEGETSERIEETTDPDPPASPPPWKSEDGVEEPGVPNLRCEVCGARFETRRGLSSHARSHLRQLGISVSESSGAPIDLLYQITKDRSPDGPTSQPLLPPPPAKKPPGAASCPRKDPEEFGDMDFEEKPIPLSILAKAVKAVPPSSSSTPAPSPGASPPPSAPVCSGSPSSVVRKAPISSLLPVSSPLRSPDHKSAGMKSLTSNLSAPAAITTSKPFWAPQETDAPLNLTLEVDPNKDIICQLCGAWFETRKGLSSHARAHLRHFGVEYSESKGSPIDLLNQLIHTDDFKHKASAMQPDSHVARGLPTTLSSPKRSILTPSSSSPLLHKVSTVGGGSASKATSSSASSLLGPPAKRPKSSSMQVFRLSSGELMALPHSDPPREIGCEFCGEYFENRKGLSSHARSHLRQMGITEWSVNGSPIDTLREIITRRGLPCALPPKPLRTPPPSSPGPPRSPLSSSSSPSSATLLSRLPFAFARPSSPQPTVSKSSPAPPAPSSGLILKLKPEPVQLDVTLPGAVGRSGGFSSESLSCSWSSSDNVFPLNLAMAHEVEPTRDIRCEFCGEYFENRKGLSSHARSHLRQMGITEWSVNGSPIDTLREIMHKRGGGASSPSDQGVKKESGQGANSPPWENTGRPGSSEGRGVSGFHSSKFRKSPLNLLHSGSRLHKQGLGPVGSSAALPAGKFFRVSPLGKRPLLEETHSVETQSPSHHLKSFSPLPHDFSFKRKSSPEKHGAGHQDASCELCGFYFENRKALASHARAHLRQFGVTEWCVNGSPIETLSAWMRSRPQKVVEMHRSYMHGNRSSLKKKSSSPLSPLSDFDHLLPISSQKASSSSSSSSQWSTVAVRPVNHEVKTAEVEAGSHLLAPPIKPIRSSPSPSRPSSALPLQAQVARSELNVRLPRGFERRPLKHPSYPDGTERESGPPKPPRTGTVPSLVPKPPSYPLVKLVGKFYTLKCRFCEVEFHGPLSVQEDWIRHLQQHILKMNYNKPAAPRAASTQPPTQAEDPHPIQASASTSSTTSTTTVLTSTPTCSTAPIAPPTPNSSSPTPPAECPPTVTATQIVKVSEEHPTLTPTPTPVPVPTQTV
ncbi:protein Wiz [Diretmus argenteus]